MAGVAALAAAALAGCGAGAGSASSSLSDRSQVFVLDRTGGDARRLTHDRHNRLGLAWSPGSDLIASSFASGIDLLSPSGGRRRSFKIAHVNDDDSLAWSPNGRSLAYETVYDNRQTGAIDAYLKSLAVGTGARRTLARKAALRPSWTPGGRTLIYIRGDVVGVSPDSCTPPPDRPPDPNCVPETPVPDELWRVGADGKRARPILRNASTQFPPQVSPDGRRLLFAREPAGDEGSVSVWVSRIDGSHQKRLAGGLTIPDVAWAPDGRDVVVLSAGRSRSWAFVLKQSARRRKLPRVIAGGPMAWSPDAGLIAWATQQQHQTVIQAVRPDGRGRRILTRMAAGVQIDELAWSPDGRRLAFTASKPPPED